MYLFKRGLLPNYFWDMFTVTNQIRQRDWASSDRRRVREKDRKAIESFRNVIAGFQCHAIQNRSK